MLSWLWPEKEEASEDEQNQYIYNGIGNFNEKGALCETPKFIGPNFSRLADKEKNIAFFPSFSRTIPEEELNCAKAIASRATIESNRWSLGAPTGNFSHLPQASALGASESSRLRLKAQYIFNVYEEVTDATEKKQEITQHISNSFVSKQSPKITSSYSSVPYEPFSLLKNSLAAVALCLVYFFATIFWHDYTYLLEQAIQDNAEAVRGCAEQFTRDKCSSPLPPLVEGCKRLAKCSQAGSQSVEKTTLAVKLLGRLVSEFLSVLTLKELSYITLCTFTVLMGSLAIRNFFWRL